MKIETQRCIFRKMENSDLDHFILLNSDPNVREYLGGPKNRDVIINEFSQILHQDSALVRFMIFHKETKGFIGMVSLDKHHDSEEKEVSYMLSPKWWKKGYGSEVLSKFLDFSFNDLHLKTVLAETQTQNIASCKLLEKNGMVLLRRTVRFGAAQSIYKKEASS